MTQPNSAVSFFDLLGLDPDEPWDQPTFEAALKKKTTEWSRNKVQGVGKRKAEAEAAYRLLPTIKAELSDPEKRQVHADLARGARLAARQRIAADFEHEVVLKAARGFLLGSEAAQLVRKYAQPLGEETVRLRLKGVQIKGGAVHGEASARPLEPAIAGAIENVLSRLGASTLYEFLLNDARPIASKEPRATLLAAAERIYKETTERPDKTDAVTLRATAAGYGKLYFSSDEQRARYDVTLLETPYRPILVSADIAAGAVKALSANQVNLLIEEASRIGIDPDEARLRLIDHAAERGWEIESPTALKNLAELDLNRLRALLEEALTLVEAARQQRQSR